MPSREKYHVPEVENTYDWISYHMHTYVQPRRSVWALELPLFKDKMNPFKICFTLKLIVCLCVCFCVGMCICMPGSLEDRGLRSPRTGVTGYYELLDMVARRKTQALWEKTICFPNFRVISPASGV